MKLTILFIAFALASSVTFAQSKITPARAGVTYGKTVTADKAVGVAALKTELSKDSVYKGKISGEVVEVCKKKGCFMKIKQLDGSSPIMVQFTDYAFFMPQNIVGKKVVVEGVAKLNETSVTELRHYAADAGKTKDEIASIVEPKKDIHIMADGVLVVE
ncbi:uncharacterized protein DUF4920 [Mucilaginibacter gracilis]|uniref:Uncharacterized protein DUF4920 n=1 Tax=Mucilaginibacter gracilis TaxID=423350 RepID=A0A495J3K8_9SPHI|nr:DUF4920 domain-containing protein [Mucilaginibacter gracilis]RKR82958.1 uncharacterized protein DUF4920 [Mucilaginibacter gracilis]